MTFTGTLKTGTFLTRRKARSFGVIDPSGGRIGDWGAQTNSLPPLEKPLPLANQGSVAASRTRVRNGTPAPGVVP
jgi:hypothetical protein